MAKNSNSNIRCKKCGNCCRDYDHVPLTILDIHRIAHYMKEEDKKIFQKVVGGVSGICGVFKIAQKEKEAECRFLNEQDLCSIHKAKPNVCRFHQCPREAERGNIDWTAHYYQLSQKSKLWEQSLAAKITEKYIKENNSTWQQEDYYTALNSIEENIINQNNPNLQSDQSHQDNFVPLLHDCSQCEKQDQCSEAIPVTLDDINRISNYLNIPPETFFENYIAANKCLATGGLKLQGAETCQLFNNEKQECVASNARPLHCFLTGCKMKKYDSNKRFLFLESGTIEGQFRHQIALQLTKNYVSQYGVTYNQKIMNNILVHLNEILKNPLDMENLIK